jgi:hypothetical protein
VAWLVILEALAKFCVEFVRIVQEDLQCSLFANVFDQLIVGDEAQFENPRRSLDQNEHQCCNLVRDIALDGLASRVANILSPLHTRNILAEIVSGMSFVGNCKFNYFAAQMTPTRPHECWTLIVA